MKCNLFFSNHGEEKPAVIVYNVSAALKDSLNLTESETENIEINMSASSLDDFNFSPSETHRFYESPADDLNTLLSSMDVKMIPVISGRYQSKYFE